MDLGALIACVIPAVPLHTENDAVLLHLGQDRFVVVINLYPFVFVFEIRMVAAEGPVVVILSGVPCVCQNLLDTVRVPVDSGGRGNVLFVQHFHYADEGMGFLIFVGHLANDFGFFRV